MIVAGLGMTEIDCESFLAIPNEIVRGLLSNACHEFCLEAVVARMTESVNLSEKQVYPELPFAVVINQHAESKATQKRY